MHNIYIAYAQQDGIVSLKHGDGLPWTELLQPCRREQLMNEEPIMKIKDAVAVITGAAGGIGRALSVEMARRQIGHLALVDASEAVQHTADSVNELTGSQTAVSYIGDVTDANFRSDVYADVRVRFGRANICVPAAGITRDRLAVKVEKNDHSVAIYPIELFRQVTEINLIAPIYWAMEMVAGIAEARAQEGLKRWEPTEPLQGTVIFIGSVSSLGNKGQIAYAASKAGLEGATATLMMEAIFHGVRCGIIHPGYTDTPMVRALGEPLIQEQIIPNTQLRRLIRPEEIADAICFMISNAAVSGSLWADAGWHPRA